MQIKKLRVLLQEKVLVFSVVKKCDKTLELFPCLERQRAPKDLCILSAYILIIVKFLVSEVIVKALNTFCHQISAIPNDYDLFLRNI